MRACKASVDWTRYARFSVWTVSAVSQGPVEKYMHRMTWFMYVLPEACRLAAQNQKVTKIKRKSELPDEWSLVSGG